MKIYLKNKPRPYKVGSNNQVTIKDFGKIEMKANEQLSFVTNNGVYDFCRKDWGFYGTPSINKRLKKNKFETYLVKNIFNDIYLWVVEQNRKNLFMHYLKNEKHEIIIRLDNIDTEKKFKQSINNMFYKFNRNCDGVNLCQNNIKNIKTIFNYNSKPNKEPDYKIKRYKRKIVQCKKCEHFFAVHKINTSKLYEENYSLISHGKDLEKKFKKILSLKENSDNFYRVKRILAFFKKIKNKNANLLDIGSGLGIFLYELRKKVKWKLSGVEPDKNFSNFSKKSLKLKIYNNDFKTFKLKKKFDIITLNKVIEHVKDPDLFLKKTKTLIKKNGYIYIEVPDGMAARYSKEGKNREEFFLDHLHVFSLNSLKNSIVKNNFKLLSIKTIREKSGKFTIFAFAQLN